MGTSASMRQALEILRHRFFVSREIDEAEYDRLVGKLVSPLSPSERAELGVCATSVPATRPIDATTPVAPVAVRPLGPSGPRGGALMTAPGSRSELDLAPGAVLLGQWRVERELGRGGFGMVVLAEDLTLRQRQAVKVLDPVMVARQDLLERFREEVRSTRGLVHQRIVRVYDYREDLAEGLALFSMEFIQGTSVAELIAMRRDRGESVPVPLALAILRQVLEALQAAHAQGVIHRDVTPANILLAAGTADEILERPEVDPMVKLVDFGIAGALERSERREMSRVLGTAAYAAPEIQLLNVPITPAVDVYGAGAVAYELVTGRPPLGRYLDPSHYRSDLPIAFEKLILRLLEAEPGSRPTAVEAFRAVGTVLQLSAVAVPETKTTPIEVRPASAEKRSAPIEERPRMAETAQREYVQPDPEPDRAPPAPTRMKGMARLGLIGMGIALVAAWVGWRTLAPGGGRPIRSSASGEVSKLADSTPRPVSGTEVPSGAAKSASAETPGPVVLEVGAATPAQSERTVPTPSAAASPIASTSSPRAPRAPDRFLSKHTPCDSGTQGRRVAVLVFAPGSGLLVDLAERAKAQLVSDGLAACTPFRASDRAEKLSERLHQADGSVFAELGIRDVADWLLAARLLEDCGESDELEGVVSCRLGLDARLLSASTGNAERTFSVDSIGGGFSVGAARKQARERLAEALGKALHGITIP